jgi:hypothetical protein
MSPKDAWKKAQTLPFTGEELRSIAGNVAPFLR